MSYIRGAECVASQDAGKECPRCLDTAFKLFHRFHSFSAPWVERAPCRRMIPRVLVHLGTLRGLIYSSDKWDPGRPKSFIHFMETPPRLACDPDGVQLYIIGGKYRVTRRGIEG
jgi:hypothetical protein